MESETLHAEIAAIPAPLRARQISAKAAPAREARDVAHRYTRFVGRAKLVLPLIAGGLIMLLAAWPYLGDFGRLDRDLAQLDPTLVKDLRMLHPYYNGVDRRQRPFQLTAENAREVPENDQILALDGPRAHLQSRDGTVTEIEGDIGIYQPEAHELDLSGHVAVRQQRGYVLRTDSAHVDLGSGLAEGNRPVFASGPTGSIEGEGFRVLNGGESMLFTGRAHLVMAAAAHDPPGRKRS